MKRKK